MAEPLPVGFRNGYQLKAFVEAAIRLPTERLRRIDHGWDTMRNQRAVISELEQRNAYIQAEVKALRAYIAKMTRRLDPGAELLPEEVVKAIFPAACAILLRQVLQASSDPHSAAAFAALTEPFGDILPVP